MDLDGLEATELHKDEKAAILRVGFSEKNF